MKEVCLPGCSRVRSECCHNWLNNGKRDDNDSKIWMRSSILYNIIYRSEAPVYAFLIYCKQWTTEKTTNLSLTLRKNHLTEEHKLRPAIY